MKGITNLQILNHSEGRFGNQLFRVGTLIGQSIEKNTEYFIPSEWEHCDLFPNLKNVIPSNDIRSNIDNKHHETKFGIHQIEISDKITEIIGYYQSNDFFKNYELNLRNDLKINENYINNIKNKINPDTIKLCVHIRWGDPYDRIVGGGHKGVEDKHPIMTLNYYEKSIEYITQNRKIDEIYIFTDNTDTKEFILNKFDKYQLPITYFDYSEDFISDFITQYLCNHFVIANSTFSWWSSYLSNSDDKIVCSPQPHEWFGKEYSHLDT
jgi:hypothetical protein